MTLGQLKLLLDKEFGYPFLPLGLVKAVWRELDGEMELDLSIGRRDVTINEEGEVMSAGTSLMPQDQ